MLWFQEQEKIAKTGLEMKLATSEMEAETERWQDGVVGGPNVDENNDIVKRARNMSRMALSMYQFTKGDGPLKTTQDLFTQAEYFAEEANRLYKVVRQFSYQVRSQVQLWLHIPISETIFLIAVFSVRLTTKGAKMTDIYSLNHKVIRIQT